MRDFARDYAFGADVRPTAFVPEAERRELRRLRAGERQGRHAQLHRRALDRELLGHGLPSRRRDASRGTSSPHYPNVDGIVALTHGTGCGMADRGEGFATLQRTLWGFARHPNFAGVLMIGLGCEVNQIDFLLEAYQIQRGPHFRTMTMQGTGGTRKTIERAQAMIREMLPHANAARRQRDLGLARSSLALQCGGSDGYSGITANPALGACADLLVRHGGTAILSETPEIYGAEHLLTRRAVTRAGRREAGRAHPLVGGVLRATTAAR